MYNNRNIKKPLNLCTGNKVQRRPAHRQACLKTLAGRPQSCAAILWLVVSCLPSRGTSASSTVVVWTLPKQIHKTWNNSILINYSLKKFILICPSKKYIMIQRIFKLEIWCWVQSNSLLNQYFKSNSIHYWWRFILII